MLWINSIVAVNGDCYLYQYGQLEQCLSCRKVVQHKDIFPNAITANTLPKTPIWSGLSLTALSFAHTHVLALKTSGGQGSQALGRSRGGFSTKIHIAVDSTYTPHLYQLPYDPMYPVVCFDERPCNPLHFMLTAGQRHDITC